MNPQERVLTACAFRRPDRIPRFESFWELPAHWPAALGPLDRLTDVVIWYPDESPFPTRARRLKKQDGYIYEVDNWGRTVRRKTNAFFVKTLEAPLADDAAIDTVEFDSPALPQRYLTGKADPSVTYPDEGAMRKALGADKENHCVFAKTGGPYLRSTYVRDETRFLMDIASDPPRARAIAEKMARHLVAVGIEELRRWDLHGNGIWIYDDMAFNHGPMFSPGQFGQVLLPAYRYMIKAYKDAGARYVFLHSDGDIRLLLDMLVDAGIDGINPMERRANMNIADLRQRYGHLILTGGMCNTHTLIHGTKADIEAQAREIIDIGRDGGVVIGTHSVSPEIPLENFLVYHQTCLTYGNFSGEPFTKKSPLSNSAGERA